MQSHMHALYQLSYTPNPSLKNLNQVNSYLFQDQLLHFFDSVCSCPYLHCCPLGILWALDPAHHRGLGVSIYEESGELLTQESLSELLGSKGSHLSQLFLGHVLQLWLFWLQSL